MLLLALTSGIAICRIPAQLWPIAARYSEVGIGYLILGLGCWIGLSALWRAIGLTVLIIAAYASFSFPGYHFVVLTHLHNLVPLIFLWDWARRVGPSTTCLAFRLTQVLWILLCRC